MDFLEFVSFFFICKNDRKMGIELMLRSRGPLRSGT